MIRVTRSRPGHRGELTLPNNVSSLWQCKTARICEFAESGERGGRLTIKGTLEKQLMLRLSVGEASRTASVKRLGCGTIVEKECNCISLF